MATDLLSPEAPSTKEADRILQSKKCTDKEGVTRPGQHRFEEFLQLEAPSTNLEGDSRGKRKLCYKESLFERQRNENDMQVDDADKAVGSVFRGKLSWSGTRTQ
ncbi:hypothetical protein CDL15_Pgr006234 [Punica granatum]|uniref:Uncharacterized protein n=1 Tax=Punica granatum TaxID=22663 RepID=A0A218X5I5_PUNGR|nr:hypothetical protein CDL15_Pgr006234 [Punica granatum]PKI73878.1 hypothetical protein CRG98_005748 [Punica granatum]